MVLKPRWFLNPGLYGSYQTLPLDKNSKKLLTFNGAQETYITTVVASISMTSNVLALASISAMCCGGSSSTISTFFWGGPHLFLYQPPQQTPPNLSRPLNLNLFLVISHVLKGKFRVVLNSSRSPQLRSHDHRLTPSCTEARQRWDTSTRC